MTEPDPDREALECAALRREAEANPIPPGLYVCRCDHAHAPDASWCYLCEYPLPERLLKGTGR